MAAREPSPDWQQDPPDASSGNHEQKPLLPASTSPPLTTPQRAATTVPPTPTRPTPHRPSTSPMLHASHAMVLQLQEYRERVQSACQSTYQFSLQTRPRPPKPSTAAPADPHRRDSKGSYCRAHVLASSRQFFHARESAPSSHSSMPVSHAKDRVLPHTSGAHVNFYHMTSRRDEFLFGDHTGVASRRPRVALDRNRAVGVAKDHFALGPGQYDVQPTTGTSVKFSPSDRFHDDFSTAQLGPGQYITSDELTTPRAAAAVFSQTPRRTEASVLISPTANTVSSYYYVPASSFVDKNAPQNDLPSWPRMPRLSSQRRTTASVEAHKHRVESNSTDYVEKNRAALETQSAVQRVRTARVLQGRLQTGKRRQCRRRRDRRHDATDESHSSNDRSDDSDSRRANNARAPVTRFKRRSSIFLDIDPSPAAAVRDRQQQPSPGGLRTASSASTTLVLPASDGDSSAPVTSALSTLMPMPTAIDRAVRGLVTLASIATFSVRLARIFHVMTIVRRIARTEREHVQRVVFSAWRQLDHAHVVQHATHVIVASSFRLRFELRIRRKCAHVAILREFLSGLSVDVQFAVAMKKIKRKVQLLQRWWRHVQLMVRAREQALFHKWVSVETRLRLEYINQMPHLQRIFQQPAVATGTASDAYTSNLTGVTVTTAASSRESETPLQRLLNVPDQRKWFTAHFVLTSDGCLRGYSDGAGNPKALIVEVKHLRCHFHDSVAAASDSDGAPTLQAAYTGYSNARSKPFLMVFRPGAFRFVLLTSPSPMPTELLAWKDKLERLVVAHSSSSGSVASAFGSFSGSGSIVGSGTFLSEALLGFHHRPSVGDFAEVSVQSGVLTPSPNNSSLALFSSLGDSNSTLSGSSHVASIARVAGGSGSTRPVGKLQARVRSLRQRNNRAGLVVTEGELSYYVVDLLKDCPKVPVALVWQTIREKLREKRKSFRAELYRYNLELVHFHRHREQTAHIRVLDKFREFFVRIRTDCGCGRFVELRELTDRALDVTRLASVVHRRSSGPNARTSAASCRTARWRPSSARYALPLKPLRGYRPHAQHTHSRTAVSIAVH